MTTKNFRVEGMTCGHCVSSVTEEVSEVVGVSTVEVSLENASMTVSGEGFDDQQVLAAVTEAGYTAAPTP